jgi:hypothetical protein
MGTLMGLAGAGLWSGVWHVTFDAAMGIEPAGSVRWGLVRAPPGTLEVG